MERKNYSFYMPCDFDDKLKKIQDNDDRLQSLSKSQALYFLIADLASKYFDNSSGVESP